MVRLTRDFEDRILVFDVGGSHIASALFAPSMLELGPLSQSTAPVDGDPEMVFEKFQSLAERTLEASPCVSGIALAVPNPFDYDRGVSYMQHKYKRLYGCDFRSELAKRVLCDPTRIHFLNDAAAFLIGELYRGAARGADRAVGITLGTGVGSAFAVGGEIVVEAAGVPRGGEIWNLPYGDGIVEDAVSTRAIQRRYEQLTGTRAEVRDIANPGKADPAAPATFDDFGTELGKVLRHTCLAFAPERIIIGGGIARAAPLFQRALQKELAAPLIRLSVSELWERAPLLGAGVSWMKRHMPQWVARSNGRPDVLSR
jgi:glucokinase